MRRKLTDRHRKQKKYFLYLVLYIFLYFLEEKIIILKFFSWYTNCKTDIM